MFVAKSISEIRHIIRTRKKNRKIIGFVPTMGTLHEGHLSLIRKARRECNCVVVSIFVNPAQFGPREDFNKYPRNFKRDYDMCKKEGVDIIFYPGTIEMYLADYRTHVTVRELSDIMCGKFRPGHFEGVTTIVAKLFNIVQPDLAYFGQKDAQQAIIIKKMVKDLNIPVKLRIMPTVRQKNGLALSSRNVYLSDADKRNALVLYQALKLAKDLIRKGNTSSSDIIRKMKQLITKKNVRIQYIVIVDADNLGTVYKINGKVLIALAAFIGRIRLIDNIILTARSKYKH